jgi:serine/threonine protein phosphatase PrpC
MSFIVRDSLSLPGSQPNEDAFAHSENAALVMDGTTVLGEGLMPGTSDAAWLAQFGSRRLMAHLKESDAPKLALAHALGDAEKSFAALRRRPVREKWETPCASMMLAVESGVDLEFLWFGDCAALLLKNQACEIIGDAFDKRGQEAERARQVAKEKNLPPAPDLNRPEILSVLRAARNRVNSGSYWLFSPEPRAADHVSRRVVKNADGGSLLVASDGFLALATDYGAYDAMGLIRAASDKGLAALGAELRAIENDDPLGEKFARFKKSDDATALLLDVI